MENTLIALYPFSYSQSCMKCSSTRVDVTFKDKMIDDFDCEIIENFIDHLQCRCEDCKNVWYTETYEIKSG